MQRHQRVPSWGFSVGFRQLKLEHWIRCCLECLKVSIRVPQSTAPSSKQSHHFSALLPPIVAAVVLLFDGVMWNLLAAIQLKSFWVQRGLRAIFISNWFDSRPCLTELNLHHNLSLFYCRAIRGSLSSSYLLLDTNSSEPISSHRSINF